VFILQISPHIGSAEPGFELTESFSIGERVTVLKGDGSRILIGTESGTVIMMEQFAPEKRFCELYRILANRVWSLGKFNKAVQRFSRSGRYIVCRNEICDMAVVRDFSAMTPEEQAAVLQQSNFPLAEALELIRAIQT
jgi:hypothetical protein